VSVESRLQAAADLARAFDAAFAAPPRRPDGDLLDLLALRLAERPYAIRLTEISGLAAHRKVVPLPSRMPELLGLAGIRGSLVPVYSLAALVHDPPPREGGGWLALCRAPEPVALAFDELEGLLRVPRSDLLPADGACRCVHHVARARGAVLPIVDVPAVLEAIQQRVGVTRPTKER
jgi:chemotaxis signal transduction protein